MADPAANSSHSQTMNETGTVSTTITIDATDTASQEDTVQLKLRKPSGDRKVKWSTETIDNEHMDKKKSKCCCIYNKPRAFGESSSDSDESDNENCDHHGNKKKKRDKSNNGDREECEGGEAGDVPDLPQTQTIILRLPVTESTAESQHVREVEVAWTPETIDNEFLNKKKSKKCCIYHKPRAFGESSSSSSCDSNEENAHNQSQNNPAVSSATAEVQTQTVNVQLEEVEEPKKNPKPS